ncbi:hypothetical protein H0A61_00009 [Koleobacter methoxysyntrophicus]|uniref:Uncharacterized protein n=1 Tax=Koleobacter methoxysyntrophicus TaxID=2751313 RepID=A0A8A0RHM1_9FIRM|nr:hypothetical protein [Koleobacter methoxysyntrophicus]QSQ07693.1 hypothetical protein H0A61_00009 [Koleobacter methoxysyntrophicus]
MLRFFLSVATFMKNNNYDHLTYEQKRAVIKALERRKQRLITMFETEKFVDDFCEYCCGGSEDDRLF